MKKIAIIIFLLTSIANAAEQLPLSHQPLGDFKAYYDK